MKLLVTSPTCWPSEAIVRQKAWLYFKSCEKFGITPQYYGVGGTRYECVRYEGTCYMRVTLLLDFLAHERKDFTHVLFTDSWDVLFTAPLDEIIGKYRDLGSPPFLSSGSWGVNDPPIYENAGYDDSVIWRYPGSAMYIAEIQQVMDIFSRLDQSHKHDESYAYVKGWKEGWFRPAIDSQCVIFQDQDRHCTVKDGRLYNEVTGTTPCALHLGSDYADPETGKDYKVKPWAERLGIL